MNKECLILEPLRKLFESISDKENHQFLLAKLPKGIEIIQGHANMVLISYQGTKYWINIRRNNDIIIEKYTGVFTK